MDGEGGETTGALQTGHGPTGRETPRPPVETEVPETYTKDAEIRQRRDKEQKLKDVKMKTKVREKVKRIPGRVLVLYDAVLPGSTQGTPTPGTSRDNGASCCCINALFYK